MPEDPDIITEHDKESDNVYLRAEYIRGLALRPDMDEYTRLVLYRAARSLRAYAALLDPHD